MAKKRSASEMNHAEDAEADHHSPSERQGEKEKREASTATAGSSDNDSSQQEDEQPEPYRKKLVEGEPGTLTGRPLRLYADGIFDLFHFGHAKALQQCKEAYPHVYLLVGCCNDELTHSLKGRTVMTDQERYESLRHCKWVDEVVEDAPWVLTDDFLEKHQIDYVCHDALPYSDTSGEASEGDVYARIKAMGKFLETRRTDGISTSDLIVRIISEYDTFIRRNLQRGYTGKEMNVPFLKEQGIKLDMTVDKWKQGVSGWFHREGKLRTSLRKRRRSLAEFVRSPSRGSEISAESTAVQA